MNIYAKLAAVQNELKAPKSQFNKFGGYNYRSCEDIVEAVKPLLNKYGLLLTLTDEIQMIGDRYYVKATATVVTTSTEPPSTITADSISFKAEPRAVTVQAYAREEQDKKGMDGSQITGASSSYARKYALNGLFAIDDTKDSDTTNTHGKEQPKGQSKKQPEQKEKTPRQLLIARLNELGIDANTYAAEKGLSNKTTAERFAELLKELG